MTITDQPGRIVKVDESIVYWNFDASKPTSHIKILAANTPSKVVWEICLVDTIISCKHYKLSADKNYIVLYGKNGFILVDLQNQDYFISQAPEMIQSAQSVEFCKQGQYMAVNVSTEQRIYLYDCKTKSKFNLMPCDKEKFLIHSIDAVSQLIVYDAISNKLNQFAIGSKTPSCPKYTLIGEYPMPRGLTIQTFSSNNKQLQWASSHHPGQYIYSSSLTIN